MKTNYFFFALMAITGCQSNTGSPSLLNNANGALVEMETPRTAEAIPIKSNQNIIEQKSGYSRKIIKNADYKIQVKNVDKSTSNIIKLTEQYQGFIADMNMVADNFEITNHIEIRLPSGNFEPFLNGLSKEATHTNHRRVCSNDVTAEYIDLQSRLKTKKEVKKRYADILRKQTKSLNDILITEEKIMRLQEEIESAEGRLRYLHNQSALSSIKLEIYEPKEYEPEPEEYTESFGLKIWEGFRNGWGGVSALILFFVNGWPIVFLSVFVFWKRKKNSCTDKLEKIINATNRIYFYGLLY